jgi:hypothetical protein
MRRKRGNGQVETIESTPGKKLTIIEIIEAKTSAFPLTEFAGMYGIDYVTAWDMARTGRLPAIKIGNSWRLDPVTTAEWLRQRTSV